MVTDGMIVPNFFNHLLRCLAIGGPKQAQHLRLLDHKDPPYVDSSFALSQSRPLFLSSVRSKDHSPLLSSYSYALCSMAIWEY